MSEKVCGFCGKRVPVLDERGHCDGCAQRRREAAGHSVEDASLLFAEASEPDPLLGKVLGGARLLKQVGSGGMGAVYKAEQLSLGRIVAVKVIHPDCAANPKFAARLRSEARVIAVLNHPNILQVYDVGSEDGRHFILMEFVEGVSVGDLVFQGLFKEPERCREVLRQTLMGLGHAHEKGIIHRDLKPDNILLAGSTFVKLADFGLAKVLDAEQHLTVTGTVLGTPQYMSPEAAYALPLDARSDLYSLGATFYHALAGVPPFSAPSAMALLQKHLKEPLVPLTQVNPLVDPQLARIVERMMAKEPADRYAGCAEALRALDAASRPVVVASVPTPLAIPSAASVPTQSLVIEPVALAVASAPGIGPVSLPMRLKSAALRPSLRPALVLPVLMAVALVSYGMGHRARDFAAAGESGEVPVRGGLLAGGILPTGDQPENSLAALLPAGAAARQTLPQPAPTQAVAQPSQGPVQPSWGVGQPATAAVQPSQAIQGPAAVQPSQAIQGPDAEPRLAGEWSVTAEPPEETEEAGVAEASMEAEKLSSQEVAERLAQTYQTQELRERLALRGAEFFRLLGQREWKPLARYFPAKGCKFPKDPNERKVAKALSQSLRLPESAWVEKAEILELRMDPDGKKGWSKAKLTVAGRSEPVEVETLWIYTCRDWRLDAEPLSKGILGLNF